MAYSEEYRLKDNIELAQRLEKLLKDFENGTPVWVPGIMNKSMGGTLRLMAKHGLLSELALKKLGLS